MAWRWAYVLLLLALVASSGGSSAAGGVPIRARQDRAASLDQGSPLKSVHRLEKPQHDVRKLATSNGHGAPARESFVLEGRSRWSFVKTASPSRDPETTPRRARTARGPPHA